MGKLTKPTELTTTKNQLLFFCLLILWSSGSFAASVATSSTNTSSTTTLANHAADKTDNGQSDTIHLYLDADFSNHRESSYAIQKGIEVAFDELDNQVAGYRVAFKYLDHRGNVVRSKRNYQQFLDDPKALAIFSGIHSPPLISNRTFINNSKALTLVPWAAGGPITRHPSLENWIFRLSLDDTRVADVIIDFALKEKKCVSPYLLLEDSPWGDSNLIHISQSLKKRGKATPRVSRFGWNIREQDARVMLRKIIMGGDDCIVLVANAIEGSVFAQAMLDMDKPLPLISHWGITGGNFHEKVSAKQRQALDLTFIQSCFAFTNSEQSDLSNAVFNRLKILTNGEISQPKDLKSAVGFIHAYDLSRILISAIEQAGLSGDIETDRNTIRLALEKLDGAVHGLIKTYQKPFSQFDPVTSSNAHEALHQENYCMANYGSNNEILIIK